MKYFLRENRPEINEQINDSQNRRFPSPHDPYYFM